MTDPLPLTLVDAALRGLVLALLALLALALLRERPRLAAARAGAVMALGMCVQVVSSTPLFEAGVPRLWQAPWVAVSVGNAVLFWVFVQALFDDEFALRPHHVAAWCVAAALGGLNCALNNGSGSVLAPLSLGAQRAVPLLFAGLTVLAAARRWQADLVEARRRLRSFIVVSGVAYSLAQLTLRLVSPHGRLSNASALFDVSVLALITAVIASRLLRLGSSELFPAPAEPQRMPSPAPSTRPPTAADPAEQALADALQRLMRDEHTYRSDDLSVASLAARLAVPEYRLRRVINQRLGHRNFNAYVNGFRLEQAQAALADPQRRELPILTIALDAGFQSIGPFNRAFKAATGLTPSDFRKQKRAVS